jgi:effector-binding domain-containing protein
MGWVEANAYRLAGSPREVYLRGPNETDDPNDYLTEVQFPVEKGG